MGQRRSLTALLVAALALTLGASLSVRAVSRDDEPVLLTGAHVPELAGLDITDIAVFVWNSGAGSYVPIPFQVDERVLAEFNPGTPYEFTQLMYDVGQQEDGTLDADDEIAFMYGDAGVTRAPSVAPWPSLVGPLSYEIEIEDPRDGNTGRSRSSSAARFVYLFTGADLPRSPVQYVSWAGTEDTPVVTERFEVGFAGRWLVNELRVKPPCGSGGDLIDRVKGRAHPIPSRQEDEEGWNHNSLWLGGLSGPVRAIRCVRGATSGFNTILQDVVYHSVWSRTVNLRVHPLSDARLYIDWLPGPGRTAFLSTARTGMPIDGTPDAVPPALALWSITRTPQGGAAVSFDLPENPLVSQRTTYYRDDRFYDDAIAENPAYGDDDNASYGATGFVLTGIGDAQVEGIYTSLRLYPLCANEGSAAVGDTLAELADHPLETESVPRFWSLGPIRTLEVQRSGGDVELEWSAAPGADSYLVYASADPALPPTNWSVLGSVVLPEFVDRDPPLPGSLRCYSVVSVVAGQQGSW